MTQTQILIACAVAVIILVAVLALWLAWSRLDLGVVRDDLAAANTDNKRLAKQRDEYGKRVHDNAAAMVDLRRRAQAAELRSRELEAHIASIEALDAPQTTLIAELERMLRKGGERP